MRTLRFKIEGNCPLLMHDDKTANPFNNFTRQIKVISSKRKKTEDDLLEMAKLEWTASLYHTSQSGYFIKAECFEATFLAAAKSKKLGTTFKQAVRIPDNPVFHFKHENLSPDELFMLETYLDYRTVKIGQSKILRCRPVFNNWHCEVEMWYDEGRLDESELLQIVEFAGKFIGVCDFRPKFGRFTAERIS